MSATPGLSSPLTSASLGCSPEGAAQGGAVAPGAVQPGLGRVPLAWGRAGAHCLLCRMYLPSSFVVPCPTRPIPHIHCPRRGSLFGTIS